MSGELSAVRGCVGCGRKCRRGKPRFNPPVRAESTTELLVRSSAGLADGGARVLLRIGGDDVENTIQSITKDARAACLHGRKTATYFQDDDVEPSKGYLCEASRQPLCSASPPLQV